MVYSARNGNCHTFLEEQISMAKKVPIKQTPAFCPVDETYARPRAALRRAGAPGTLDSPGAPKVTFTAHPTVGGKIVYLPLAPKKQGGQAQVKVILAFRMQNNESAAVTLTGVTFAFPGSSHAAVTMKYVSREIAAGGAEWWSNGVVKYEEDKSHNNAVYLNTPAPSKIKVTLTFAGYAQPLTFESSMGPFSCSAPGGAWRFPFSTDDLRPGEFYWTSAQHWANGGGAGRQIYAHDIGIMAYDEGSGEWTDKLPGSGAVTNERFRIYGKPVRAVADGTVESWHHTMNENTVVGEFPDPTPNPGGGNHIWIKHGDEMVVYTHLQKNSIPVALRKQGAAVTAGQMVGRAGNSGNSTAPHEHYETKAAASPQPLRPIPLKDCWVVDRAAVTPATAIGPWVKLNKQGIPKDGVLIWPGPTTPAWYPTGWAEVSHHAIPAEKYQFYFDRVAGSGYRPVFVNAYVVGGKTFFNIIFRPAGNTAWVARHGMTGAGYQTEFDTHTGKGFRLENVCAYLSAGKVRYAAIWSKAAGPGWVAAHGRSLVSFLTTHADWTAKGYRPVNVSVVEVSGAPQYTMLYEKRNTGKLELEHYIPVASYQAAWDKHTKAGLRLAYVSACNAAGGARITAIFQQTAPGSGNTVGRHNFNSSQYQAEFDNWVGQGLLTRAIAGYQRNSTHNFAAVWRKD
jgi:hypothetical protein